MRKKKYIKKLVLAALLCVLALIYLNPSNDTRELNKIQDETKRNQESAIPRTKSQINTNSIEFTRDFFDVILQENVNSQIQLGYYPTIHPPSLHATFYALYILDSIDRLEQIDLVQTLEFIMSHYNDTSGVFNDMYSKRYLDTDLAKGHPPSLTSQLEINCYSVFSLSILGELDQIDVQKMENYLWSCQHPTEGGFLGQPFSEDLTGELALPTADNTYFAVEALDLLISDWSEYVPEKNKIFSYLLGLQSEEAGIHLGGFNNEEDSTYKSLIIDETNLLAAFYCLKTLSLWDATFYLDSNDFESYLEYLYNPTSDYFVIAPQSKYFCTDYCNLMATALGLDLARLIGYNSFNVNEILTYLLNNRNEMGIWDKSTQIPYHELVYTYQIIRSLKEAGEISGLNSAIKNEIASGIQQFFFHDGFSLMSADYTSQEKINALVNAFYNHDVNSLDSLDIPYLFSQIEGALFSIPSIEYYQMYSYTGFDGGETFYHSQPFEYKTTGTHERIHEFNAPSNQRSMYHALDSLYKLDMIDDFEIQTGVSGNNLMNMIIACQFLESGYSQAGGFSPDCSNIYFENELRNSYIYPEHSFYAIKSLELLAEYLNLGTISEIAFDHSALSSYLLSHKFENATHLYFIPSYTMDTSEILETTYQCIYILKALDLFTLDAMKIKTYLQRYMNPTTIEELYYTYKIRELLNLDFTFDWDSCTLLIEECYSDSLLEFLNSPQKKKAKPYYLGWILEMLSESSYTLSMNYSQFIPLDTTTMITATYSNLMKEAPEGEVSIEFESPQLGFFTLEPQSNIKFSRELFIPWNQENYPQVEGILRVRINGIIREEKEITFKTYPRFRTQKSVVRNEQALAISFNISLLKFGGPTNIIGTQLRTNLYRNNDVIQNEVPIITHYSKYSIVEFNHAFEMSGTYFFNISMEHSLEQWNEPLLEKKELFFRVLSPIAFQYCNESPPALCIETKVLNLDTIWYTLDDGHSNHTFSQNGTLSLEAWEAIDNGPSILTVYLNDTFGAQVSTTIPILKDTLFPVWFPFIPMQEIFGFISPLLNLEVSEENLISTFYQLINPLNQSQYSELIPFNSSEPLNVSQEEWEQFPDGEVNITVYATDSSDNIATQSITVTKDSTPPSISVNNPIEDSLHGNTPPSYSITTDELLYSNAWYYLERGNQRSEDIALTGLGGGVIDNGAWRALSDGKVSIHFQIQDLAGNIGSASVEVIKDTTAPDFDILEPAPNECFGFYPPSFKLRIRDPNYKCLSVTINGFLRKSYYSNGTIANMYWMSTEEGVVILTFYVEDLAGNEASKSVSIIKDESGSGGGSEEDEDNPFNFGEDDEDTETEEKDPMDSIIRVHLIWSLWYGVNLIFLVISSFIIRGRSLTKLITKLAAIPPPALLGAMWLIRLIANLISYLDVIFYSIYFTLGIFSALIIVLAKKAHREWKNRGMDIRLNKAVKSGVAEGMIEGLSKLGEMMEKIKSNNLKSEEKQDEEQKDVE